MGIVVLGAAAILPAAFLQDRIDFGSDGVCVVAQCSHGYGFHILAFLFLMQNQRHALTGVIKPDIVGRSVDGPGEQILFGCVQQYAPLRVGLTFKQGRLVTLLNGLGSKGQGEALITRNISQLDIEPERCRGMLR